MKRRQRATSAPGTGGPARPRLQAFATSPALPVAETAAEQARARGLFATYSPRNVALILMQRPGATDVAGFAAWRARGRCVRKGEHGLLIIAPLATRPGQAERQASDAPDEETGAVPRGFRPAFVFDVTQTDPASANGTED
jgi:hypothetical protein